MTPTVRFAPSPTGNLHAGNIRPAVLNFLFAKANSGRFMLRLDDTDAERSTDAFARGIERDLAWLGLTWDQFARQSDRMARYEEVAGQLRASGRLYACYESAGELDRKRKRQLARGLPPIYDRAGLRLTAAERQALEAQGLRPHWRFQLANTETGSLAPAPTIVSWELSNARQRTSPQRAAFCTAVTAGNGELKPSPSGGGPGKRSDLGRGAM